MIMSSFLMNTGAYVDPKFPPSEEYNQSSYMPTAATEYYVPHQSQHYGYAVNSVNGIGSHQGASMGYYAQHPSHGGGYYGAPCGMGPGQVPMTGHVAPTTLGHHHQQHSSPGLLHRSPVPSPTPSLTSMAPCGTQPQSLSHHVSPLLHQHLQPLHHSNIQGHGIGPLMQQHSQLSQSMSQHHGSMGQQQSNQQHQTQLLQQSNALQLCQPPTPNSPESDIDDGSDSDESQNPVIYPWMKKIHVAGASKSSDDSSEFK